MKKCPFCKNGILFRETRAVTYNCKDESIIVNQPGEYCDLCGEGILNDSDMQATMNQIKEMHDKVRTKNEQT